MADRGRETGNALSEVRTVLSRAETALATLRRGPTERSYDEDGKPLHVDGLWPHYDQDHAEMVEALETVVSLLDEWRRTGRTKP